MPVVTDLPQIVAPQKVIENGTVIKSKEEEKEKKKRRTGLKLTSEVLFSDNGLKKLKTDFNPQMRSLGVKGQEVRSTKRTQTQTLS
jgi:hypothetical protein